MGETRNTGRHDRADLRLAIAREVLQAMVGAIPPTVDMLDLDEDALARKALAIATALLEAHEGNAQ
jgi:hypothetical protein